MATTLGGTFKIGNASASSLVKSAATLTNELNTYNDTINKIIYENSAKTASDLQVYRQYLQGRISTLSSSGSVTDATKAANLSQEIITATHGNISADIQRENISIMAGNATPTDKLNLIESQFTRALSIGDQALGQTLESQAYSLQQTIEQAAQTAATANAALSKASASNTAAGEESVASQLKNNLDQLNKDVGAGGGAALNSNLLKWVANNKGQLTTLANSATDPGIKASILKAINTSQPNYQDVVNGVGNAMITAHYLAYQAELPVDPRQAQTSLDAANNLANGTTPISTLAGSMPLQDIQTWQANPAMMIPTEDVTKGTLTFTYGGNSKAAGSSAISGFKFGAPTNVIINGKTVSVPSVIANFTGATSNNTFTDANGKPNTQLIQKTNNALKALGLSNTQISTTNPGGNTNGLSVQFTGAVPKWLKPITAGQQNLRTQVYVQQNGAIEIATLDANGQGHVYAVATDNKGQHALYQGTPDANGNVVYGKQNAKGDYGFDQNNNNIIGKVTNDPSSGKTIVEGGVASIKDPTKNLTGGTSSAGNNYTFGQSSFLTNGAKVNDMVNQSQATISRIQAAKTAAMAADAAAFKASQIVAPPAYINMPTPQSPAQIKLAPMPQVAMPKPVGTQALGQNAAGTTGLQTANGGLHVSGGMPGGAAGLF